MIGMARAAPARARAGAMVAQKHTLPVLIVSEDSVELEAPSQDSMAVVSPARTVELLDCFPNQEHAQKFFLNKRMTLRVDRGRERAAEN